MNDKLKDRCKDLGWIAIGCLSLYIILAFVLSIVGLGLSFLGIFGALLSDDSPSTPATPTPSASQRPPVQATR